jgi:hypothetical protein
MEESSIYRGKIESGKSFSFELWKKHNTESIGAFSSNMNSLRITENLSYRSSTVYVYIYRNSLLQCVLVEKKSLLLI